MGPSGRSSTAGRSCWWSYPASIAALTSAFLLYLKLFVPMTLWVEKGVGIGILLGLAFINARGAKQGAGVQNLFTVLKVARTRRAHGAGDRHAARRLVELPAARCPTTLLGAADRHRAGDDLDAVCLRRLAVRQLHGRRDPRPAAQRAPQHHRRRVRGHRGVRQRQSRLHLCARPAAHRRVRSAWPPTRCRR